MNVMTDLSGLSRRRFFALASAAAAGSLLPRVASAEIHKHADLPYAFDALEPVIDARTMELHHGRHHGAQVNNLNNALADASELAAKSLDELMASLSGIEDKALQTALRNNGGGHWNHDFFWNIMTSPSKSGQPSDALAKAITESFGSMDEMKAAFNAAAGGRFGSGWAWLIHGDDGLKVTSTPNQDNPLMAGLVSDDEVGTPLLGIDVWEHAYYLHYQNRRADYVTAWWDVVNWEHVSESFAAL